MINILKRLFPFLDCVSTEFSNNGWSTERKIEINDYSALLTSKNMKVFEEAKLFYSNIGDLLIIKNGAVQLDSRLMSFPGKDYNHTFYEEEAGQELCWVGNTESYIWGRGYLYIGVYGNCFVGTEKGDIYSNKLKGYSSLFGILNGNAKLV